jgi:hypothetical protein
MRLPVRVPLTTVFCGDMHPTIQEPSAMHIAIFTADPRLSMDSLLWVVESTREQGQRP